MAKIQDREGTFDTVAERATTGKQLQHINLFCISCPGCLMHRRASVT